MKREAMNCAMDSESEAAFPSDDDHVSSIVLEPDNAICKLKEEVSALRSQERSIDCRRGEALDKLIDLKGSIRVFCRLRPSGRDKKPSVSAESTGSAAKINVRMAGAKKEYILDRVFSEEASQDDVFQEVRPILRSALDGHNVCILAYGQTGTGKTYTMEGTARNLGIVPRAMEELFCRTFEDKSCSYAFSISILEVYRGNLRDLLAPRQPQFRSMEVSKCNLAILAESNGSVEIDGLTDVAVSNLKRANQWYSKGRSARSTAWTNVNKVSSRSHCLTRITIRRSEVDKETVSKLWLVDLGGSERLLKTGARGLTMGEGKAINLSLSAFGNVVSALRRKCSHVPYRNSKLTQILSDSLGHDSKVLMMVHISIEEDDLGETICSLTFANRARSMDVCRDLPEELKLQKQTSIVKVEQDIRETEEQLQKVMNQIEAAQNSIQQKLSSMICHSLSERGSSPPSRTLIVDRMYVDLLESLLPCRKFKCKPVPHFMASTANSRQRVIMVSQSSAGHSRNLMVALGLRSANRRSWISEPATASKLGFLSSSKSRKIIIGCNSINSISASAAAHHRHSNIPGQH